GQEIRPGEALVAVAEPRFCLPLPIVEGGGGARVVDPGQLQQADDGARVGGPPFRGGRDCQHGGYAFGFQSLKRSRSTFLSNLPTEVLGTASMKRTSSGSHHLATSGLRKSRISLSVSESLNSGLGTTQASGRSTHCGCGTAMTAASSTLGWPMMVLSMSTLEIHSPPDLIRSFVRSVIWT